VAVDGTAARAARRWTRALVTGASSGIGTELASQLAAEGVDLVLVARDVDRLERLAEDLEARCGVEVEVLPADLSSPVARAAVEKRLAEPDRPIDLLVNNAGFGTSGAFSELPVAREEQQVQLNVLAVVRLCSAVLPGMKERGAGTILNIASVAGLYPSPGSATYAATKAFVCSFSDALHEELRGTPVNVTASLPGLTRTEFHQRSNSTTSAPERAWLSAERVARRSLDAAAAGRARVVPGAFYKAMNGAVAPVPPGPRRWVVGRINKLIR
jgi:short-subunit dehydrogenase